MSILLPVAAKELRAIWYLLSVIEYISTPIADIDRFTAIDTHFVDKMACALSEDSDQKAIRPV